MENKINVAELLKDCPQGMELDCTLFEGLEFDGIVDNEYLPIRCRVKNPNGGYNVYNFTKYGCWLDATFSKCIIFPKGKTNWKGFQRPFKGGDIVISDMGDIHLLRTEDSSYCAYRKRWRGLPKFDETITTDIKVDRLATEEEKQELFDAIKSNGYKWNEETKTLEKLVEPKFKVGDKITNGKVSITIGYIDNEYYYEIGRNISNRLFIKNQDKWNLVPNKFDINTLKTFDKVLVRDSDLQKWFPALWGYYDFENQNYPYKIVGDVARYCIPYEENKHLLGTTDDCDEYYKNWE